MLEQTNALLKRIVVGARPPVVLFLTGSSGCGKTYLASAIERQLDLERSAVCYFDRIGVPSPEEMISQFGSGEKWQQVTTEKWVKTIAEMRDKALVIFEGQYNPKFALETVGSCGIADYKIAVVTAEQEVWEKRLRGPRGQAFLVTDDMRNWAKFLKQETLNSGGAVIDTSASDLDKNIKEVADLINEMLCRRVKE